MATEAKFNDQPELIHLPGIFPGSPGRKKTTAIFDEPMLSSDGGIPLLSKVDDLLSLVDRFSACLNDTRHQSYVDHSYVDMLRQRVYQITHGYEDVNDCDTLRDDPMFKLGAGRDVNESDLASQPTVCRLENSIGKKELLKLFYLFIDLFIESYDKEPEAIILDMDPTACKTYGDQQLTLFNMHVGDYCLMPFHIYEGQTGKLIATIVREGKTPTALEIIAIMKRLVKRIRQRFPNTLLIFRADGHHSKPSVLDWLDENNVHYIIGQPQNKVLNKQSKELSRQAKLANRNSYRTVTKYHTFSYAAGSWSRKRRIIARAIASPMGVDVRYVVTSFERTKSSYLYEDIYCPRGNAELYIKEHKNDMHSDRMSCNNALANQFRQCLHSAAYVLVYNLREKFLQGTELARATMGTIRLKLLKVAVRVKSGKTFTRLHFPEGFGYKSVFQAAAAYGKVT